MRFRRLGKTGLRVSAVGLGTYQFGGRWGKRFSQREVVEILSAAEDCGINLIDTAECYGENHLSETLIGQALGRSRNRWVLATKFGHERISPTKNRPAYSALDMLKQLEDSLRALRTDTIDLYQFHSGPNEAFDNEELWEMLGRQQAAGKIRHIGISVSRKSSDWRLHQTAHATAVGASVIQVKYNRVERAAETEVLPQCEAQDLGVLARVPLASGLLSGKYQQSLSFDPVEARAGKYDEETFSEMRTKIQEVIDHELPEGFSLAQYALCWALSHPAVSCVIPGCKTVDQVLANAAAADMPLADVHHPQEIGL